MLDISQVVDKVAGLFADGGAVQDVLAGNLTELFGNANIDPTILENLSLEQLGETLAGAGIDVSALTEGQVSELAQQMSENGGLEGIDLGALLGGGPDK